MMAADRARRSVACCLFTCQSRLFAVRLDVLEGIIKVPGIVRLPLCTRPVSGLCTYRGRFIIVVRPAGDREGWVAGRGGRGPTVLVLRAEQGQFGLLIDRDDIAIVADVEMEGAVDTTDGGGQSRELPEGLVSSGSIERDGKLHAIIDPDGTWTYLRAVIERGYGASFGNVAQETPSSAGG